MASKYSNMLKRMESRKSHSWWWDSHVSPKNSKWLQENLEEQKGNWKCINVCMQKSQGFKSVQQFKEMDHRVKQMLKLIEEDADSFAKKAEMYYQKRPELIILVEDFYRMYRSLAERYDHVTGELRKNIPSDLQSQCSGISDLGSEPPSTMPSPDRRPSNRKMGLRAAGFDYFLGGNGSDLYNKEGDDSSTLDSESETDDSPPHGHDEERGLRRRIIELEDELREVKEKLLMREGEVSEGYFRNYDDGNSDGPDKMAKYEEEIKCLKTEIEKYKSLGEIHDPVVFDSSIDTSESENLHLVQKIKALEEELRITEEKLHESKEEVASKALSIQALQDELKSAQNELQKERGEVLKLQDRIVRYKTNLTERDQEIRGLKEAMSNANKSLSGENEHLQGEVSRLSKERTCLEDNLKGLDVRCQVLEEELRRVKAGKAEVEVTFSSQIDQLRKEIEEKNERMEELKKNLDAVQEKYDVLVTEKDELSTNLSDLTGEVSFKDDQIDQMSRHLHQLHIEHVDLISGAERDRKLSEELKSRIKELEKEVEKKEKIIVQGAEEKREAIRQLCFSLEHYRNGYHRLREVVTGQKAVVAT